MKRVMSFSFKHGPLTTLAYDVRVWIQNLNLAELYMAVHLSGTIKALALQVDLPTGSVQLTAWSASMNTPTGTLYKKDAIQYKTDAGVSVGIAMGFARDAAFNHVALLTPLALQAGGLWQPIAQAQGCQQLQS